MPGQANDIAIGANGQIWAIGNTPTDGSFNIMKWNGSAWENIDGGGTRIAVDPKGMPWVVNSAGQVWKRDGTRWVSMSSPGVATDIGIGADGAVWIVTRTSTSGGFTIQYLIKSLAPGGFETLTWRNVEGGASRISVSPNGQPWIVNNSGQISERKNGRWESRPGAATDIGVGANGVVWAIGNNAIGGGSFGVHRWDGNSRWDAVDGGGTQIAVDHFGRPIITNHLKEIYRREYTPNTFSATPRVSNINMDYYAAGRISAICVNPNDQNHVIAAGETGGLFETTNARSASRTWRHLSAFDEYAVTDILILPVSGGGSEVYVTCLDSYKNPATPTPLIFKRGANGSRSWTRVGFTASTNVPANNRAAYRLVKSKTNNTIYAAGKFGVAMKPEGSETWQIIGMPPGSGVTTLETMADGTLVVGVVSGIAAGVYYRPNGSSSWIPAVCPVSLPDFSNSIQQRFALKTDVSGQIALITKYTGSVIQLYGSADGRNWQPFRSQWGVPKVAGETAGGYESVLPVFNTARNRLEIYVSNSLVAYYGYSGGANIQTALTNAMNNSTFPWQPRSGFNAAHLDTRQFFFLEGTPRKIGLTSDGGLSIHDVTGDNIETFDWALERVNSGLNALQIYNLTGTSKGSLYFGTQDNNFGFSSSGDGINWEADHTEGYVINNNGIGYNIPAGILVNTGTIFYKSEGFTRATSCTSPSNSDWWNSPSVGWGTPIWFGSGIYIQDDGPPAPGAPYSWKITYNNGCNWEDLPKATYVRRDLNSFFSSATNSPFNLFVPMWNGSKIILGRLSNPLNRDATNIWQYPLMSGLDGGIAEVGTEFGWNTVVAVNPINPNHLLAVEATTGNLKVSNTGGNNWTEVINFTNTYTASGRYTLKSTQNYFAVWSIEFSPFDPQIVMIGTVSRGLFLSRDGGATWTRLNFDGIFMAWDFHWKSPREVIVSTYGRGLFKVEF